VSVYESVENLLHHQPSGGFVDDGELEERVLQTRGKCVTHEHRAVGGGHFQHRLQQHRLQL